MTLAVLAIASLGCTYETGGTELRVLVRNDPADTRFSLCDGSSIGLGRAEISFDSIELEPCEGAVAERRVYSLLTSVAHAHDRIEHVVVADPFVHTLSPGPVEIATTSPPTGAYCAAKLRIGSRTGEPSVVLAGTRSTRGTRDELLIEGHGVRQRDVPFASPLVLDEARPTATLTLTLDPPRWLDGVPPGEIAEHADRIAEAILASATVRVSPSPP
jgi:hypothetical protein